MEAAGVKGRERFGMVDHKRKKETRCLILVPGFPPPLLLIAPTRVGGGMEGRHCTNEAKYYDRHAKKRGRKRVGRLLTRKKIMFNRGDLGHVGPCLQG